MISILYIIVSVLGYALAQYALFDAIYFGEQWNSIVICGTAEALGGKFAMLFYVLWNLPKRNEGQ
jgi:hypothetical protein